MGLVVSDSLVSDKEITGTSRRGQLDDVVLQNQKTLIARDRTYQSDRTHLDTTWEDVTLFKIARYRS